MRGSFPELTRVPPLPPDGIPKWWLQAYSTSIFHRKKTDYPAIHFCFSSVQLLSHVPIDCSMPGLPVHCQLPGLLILMSFEWWCHPTISSSVVPFPSCLQSFPATGSFLMSQLFTSGGQGFGVSVSASVLLISFRKDWLVWFPCSPRDSQESSPTPQFKSINSSVLSFLYCPTLTSIHDYWKNGNFDYMDLCRQSSISAF